MKSERPSTVLLAFRPCLPAKSSLRQKEISILSRKEEAAGKTQKGYIELVMKKGGFESCISDYESYGNTGHCKAYNLKLLSDRNHIKAPLYIGDTEGDRQACEKAGVPFIWAGYGFGKPISYVEKLDRFKDILDII